MMKGKSKYFWLAAAALLAALLMSGTVFAEGEEPTEPAAAPAEAAEAPPPEEQPAAEAPVEELVAGEPAAEEPVLKEPVLEEPLAAEEPLEAAEPTPEVTLVDADGRPLDMATKLGGDPYWLVGTQYYSSVASETLCYPGTSVLDGTCFVSATPIQNAINLIAMGTTPPPENGFIIIEYGVYPDVVNINGSSYPNLGNLLGLQGIDSGGAYPVLSKSVTITGLTNGFMLDGFTINGGVFVKDSWGQFVFENLTAKVSMTDVDASGNPGGDGILFYKSKGDIILKDVTANNNTGCGILILDHAGQVSFKRVAANGNGLSGVAIDNQMVDIYNITIKDSIFNHNGLNQNILGSLTIWSNGVVTLKRVAANDSNVYNGNGIYVRSGGATLRNIIAVNNTGNGIDITTSGAVQLVYIDAHDNGVNAWGGGIYVSNNIGDITLKNVRTNNHTSFGILIRENAGQVSFNRVAANGNGSNGAAINNEMGSDNITIKNSIFNHNGLNEDISGSLTIWSNGVVTLKRVVANDSNVYAGNGIRVRSGAATLSNIIAVNNTGNGVDIATSGAVQLVNLNAYNNGGRGLYVDNASGVGGVTLTGKNFFSNNYMEGVRVETSGIVSMANLVAYENGQDGVYIRAYGYDKAVTLMKVISVNNTLQGMDILTNGLTTLDKVVASHNGEDGAQVDTSGFNLTMMNSWMIENTRYGMYYKYYDPPFVANIFLTNIYAGNGLADVQEY